MTYKISAIMPVYNTENFLSRSIECVLNQTLKDFELIIVNDGSTDNSSTIIEKYASCDSRIKVINKNNQGLGYARNSGLEYATGEYIFFIDSDDTIEINTFEELYLIAIKNDPDIIVFNMKKILEDNNEVIQDEVLKLKNETINISDIGVNCYFEEYFFPYIHGHEACNKLYKHDFIKLSKVIFDSNDYICAEDLMFNIKLLPFLDKITTINKSYYNYYQRSNSIMNSGYRNNLIERFTNLVEEYNMYLINNGFYGLDDEISVLYYTLLSSTLYNEEISKGNKISTYYNILKYTRSNLCKKYLKCIAISSRCSNLLGAYGMKSYSVYIIKLFCISCYINIGLGSLVWYLYINITRFFYDKCKNYKNNTKEQILSNKIEK